MDGNVLIVEDDVAMCQALSLLLRRVGLKVWTAGSVADAIDSLTRLPVLVVLDLILPDGSGVDVLRAIRHANLQCKVAVVSAAIDPELFKAINTLKPDALFGKPLEFEDFVGWVAEAFPEEAGLAASVDLSNPPTLSVGLFRCK